MNHRKIQYDIITTHKEFEEEYRLNDNQTSLPESCRIIPRVSVPVFFQYWMQELYGV